MVQKLKEQPLWIAIALLLLALGSWKFMTPKTKPDAVAPAGVYHRMQDAAER
jgi:hypothetical protein